MEKIGLKCDKEGSKTPINTRTRILKSPLIRNISKVYGGNILSKVFAAGTSLMLIRGLSVEDYAAYTAFYGLSALIPSLVGGGVNQAQVRFSSEFLSKTGKKPLEVYFISFIFQAILYTVACVFLLVFADEANGLLFGKRVFKSSFLYGLIAGLGLLFIRAGSSVYQAEEKFGTYVKILWSREISTFLLIASLLLLRLLDFSRAVQSITIVSLVVGFVIIFFIFRESHSRQTLALLKGRLDILKDFLSSTGWLIVYFFVLTAFQRLDIFMLSHLSTEEELANYGVAFNYYSMALLLLGSINAVLLPRFSRVDMQNSAKQRTFTLKWLKATGWLVIPIVGGVVLGKSLFVWVNGVQYEKAFRIFVVFSIGIWLSLMYSPLVNILISRRAFKLLFALAVGAFVLNALGSYLLIPLWGGFGAALARILSGNLALDLPVLVRVLKG